MERLFTEVGESIWKNWSENKICYSIGPKTTMCLKKYGIRHIVQAKEASYESLANCIIKDRLIAKDETSFIQS